MPYKDFASDFAGRAAAAGVSAAASAYYQSNMSYKRQRGADGPTNVQIGEYTRCRRQRGHRQKRRKYLDQLLATGVNRYVLRFRGMNQYASAVGGYWCVPNYVQTDGGGAGQQINWFPHPHFCITSAMNFSGTGTLQFADVGPFYPVYNKTLDTIAWAKLKGGTNNSGGATDTNTLQFSTFNASSANNGMLKAAVHRYVSIKLLCYGLLALPVRFRISLIRYKRPWLVPGFLTNISPTATANNDEARDFVSVQESLCGPYRFNPLNVQDTKQRQLYDEIPIKDFVISGRSNQSVEPANIPYMHEVNYFSILNKLRKYDWATAQASIDAMQNQPQYTLQNAVMESNVNFTSRWFLTVRAQAVSRSGIGPPLQDTTTTPSFDLQMDNRYDNVR